jgi:hypothetical protein
MFSGCAMDTAAFPRFDFDEWASLARQDPQGFEVRRQEAIEQLILAAPEHLQPRLRRLQWRIDMERRRHDNPLGACIGIYGMMIESVYGEHGLLPALRRLIQGCAGHDAETATASILPFRAV